MCYLQLTNFRPHITNFWLYLTIQLRQFPKNNLIKQYVYFYMIVTHWTNNRNDKSDYGDWCLNPQKAKVNTTARYGCLSGFACVPTLNFPAVFLSSLHMHAFKLSTVCMYVVTLLQTSYSASTSPKWIRKHVCLSWKSPISWFSFRFVLDLLSLH